MKNGDFDEDNPPTEPKKPAQRMQKGEDENFLCFAAALKIMVGSAIRINRLDRAKELLEKYLLGFSQVSLYIVIHGHVAELP